MKIVLEMPFEKGDLAHAVSEATRGNAGPLRALCQKEVEAFEGMMRKHPDYADGLVKIERLAVEGYIYQKLRGHIDEKAATSNLPTER